MGNCSFSTRVGRMLLPLPEGEGRGEGEGISRKFAARALSNSWLMDRGQPGVGASLMSLVSALAQLTLALCTSYATLNA